MNPTDDELLAVMREALPNIAIPGSDRHIVRRSLLYQLRQAVHAPTFKQAAWCLASYRDFTAVDEGRLARALRSRFPQPITEAALIAEGFEPDPQTGYEKNWSRPCGENRMVAWERPDHSWRVAMWPDPIWFTIWTPDRLHDVRVALETLYRGGEG